mmetsp:Transcript_23070/g.53381  ORF Transcript_23070/g.53381 Transcript_23070/m.53381 type:complete len:253 (+) Transcript_23070:246-1004(+)
MQGRDLFPGDLDLLPFPVALRAALASLAGAVRRWTVGGYLCPSGLSRDGRAVLRRVGIGGAGSGVIQHVSRRRHELDLAHTERLRGTDAARAHRASWPVLDVENTPQPARPRARLGLLLLRRGLPRYEPLIARRRALLRPQRTSGTRTRARARARARARLATRGALRAVNRSRCVAARRARRRGPDWRVGVVRVRHQAPRRGLWPDLVVVALAKVRLVLVLLRHLLAVLFGRRRERAAAGLGPEVRTTAAHL